MNNDKITYYVGASEIINKPIPPYSEIVCDFLDELSRRLRADSDGKKFSDVIAFAFWCRKGNIQKLKKEFDGKYVRIGRGVVFHIAPSNVPVNFAFSFVFGLLSGNCNIVRVSSKQFKQTELICNVVRDLFEQDKFAELKKRNAIVSYEADQEITDYYSSISEARIIWGGDETIAQIRKSPIAARSIDVTFADRYSFAVLSAEAVMELSEDQLNTLAENFYNDTFYIDQNACSSPHLVLWKSKNPDMTEEAKIKFWNQVKVVAEKYDLEDIKVSDKYTLLCEQAVSFKEIDHAYCYDNLIYVARLRRLPERLSTLRGKFGVFYEMEISNFDVLAESISAEFQTCLVFGINKNEIVDFIVKNNLRGIDRIVPIGKALDINIVWDGYDIIGTLSRVISCQD
jgi:hypothetical protein